MRPFFLLLLVYVGLAVCLTWPVALSLGTEVPGADRTSMWTALWSLDFMHDSLLQGAFPFSTDQVQHRKGGVLLLEDPMGALLAFPAVAMFGIEIGHTLLVWLQLGLAGAMAHGFAADWLRWRNDLSRDEWVPAAFVAGIAYGTAPILLSAVHNGETSAMAGGWAAWAAWMCWRASIYGGWRRVGLAGASLMVAALSGWTNAGTAFIFAGSLFLLGGGVGWKAHWSSRLSVVALGLALVAPLGIAMHGAAQVQGNLVPPETPQQAMEIRRSTGAADPLVYLMPGPYRSPDFAEISPYGARTIHCHYLGWSLIGLSMLGFRRNRKGTGFLWLAGVTGLAMSLGPVIVRQAEPLFLAGHKVIPMPYFLVETFPGLMSLTQLYQLAQAPALALALLAASAVYGRYLPWVVAAASLIIFESRWISPMVDLPASTTLAPAVAVLALADAPDGAVLNYPVVSGRPYLYEQTIHSQPMVGGLSPREGKTARRFWRRVLKHADRDPSWFRAKISASAKRLGIRYVLIHLDPDAQPAMHDSAIIALEKAFIPLELPAYESDGALQARVIKLW